MQRRKLLSGCGIVLAGVLAGCGGGSDGDGGDNTPTSTPESGTPTETPAQESGMEGDTDTPAETATPTAESTDEFTHDIDEEFTVGEGDNAVGYRIVDLFRADRLGSSANNTTADGTFLIVVLDLTNPRSESLPFPREEFRAQTQTEDSWRRFDGEGTEKINADERLNVEQIGDATLNAGETRTGAVAYDLDPDRSYRIWITPTGAETPEHFVPVGEISSVEELQGSLTG